MAHTVLVMKDGVVIEAGSVDDVLTRPLGGVCAGVGGEGGVYRVIGTTYSAKVSKLAHLRPIKLQLLWL